MSKIKNKQEVEYEDVGIGLDNSLELVKHIGSVNHSLNDQITTDFIYTKLPDQRKEIVIEMVHNAYYGNRLYRIAEKKFKKYEWNQERQQWEARYMNKKEKEIMEQLRKNLFESFMTKILMAVTLNINVKNNYHVKRALKASEEEDKEEAEEEHIKEEKGTLNAIKKMFEKKAE